MLKEEFRKNKKKIILIIAIVFLYYTFIGLLNYVRFVTSELAIGGSGRFLFYFIMEATGSYTHMLLLPLILLIIYHFRIKRENLITYIPLHLFASMFIGACHTSLMFGSRVFIFWLFDLGEYDYGKLIYRYPMEYTHQFFSYWLIYVVVQIFRFFRNHQQQKLKTINLEKQLINAQLQALQMQVHPHFLFNTLNMISSIMYEDTKTADKMIANLSDLLRVTLNSSGVEKYSLEKELEVANYYIEIMKARFSDKLNINFNIDSEASNALVPGFILQPLIENSIKYSMEHINKITTINISAHKQDKMLKLIVSDNGPGVNNNLNELKNSGIGLSNIEERLEKLYHNDYKFRLYNKNQGGLEVLIEIPFKDLEQD